MPALTVVQLLKLRRDYCNKVAHHKHQITIAKKAYKKAVANHNKAVKKANEKAGTSSDGDNVSSSTLRRWARAVRHGDIDP
jgi:hypothetical protein